METAFKCQFLLLGNEMEMTTPSSFVSNCTKETMEEDLCRTRESLSDEIMIKRTRRRRRREPQMSSPIFPLHFQSQFLRTKTKSQSESALLVAVIIIVGSLSALCLHPPKCHWDQDGGGERLICYAEAGGSSSLIVEEEVDGMGPEHAKSLWVQCEDESREISESDSVSEVDSYFHKSEKVSSGSGFVLTQGVFMAVPSLRDLRLENCAIAGITPGALGYLPFLHNLTIKAHTSLRGSSSQLEVKAGVLRGLPELRKLDFSTTSLSSLPNDFLCFLPSLNHLNLSACGLRDLRSVGVAPTDPTNPHNCGGHIKTLDLSHNHFSLLPPATFSSVHKSLEELRLEHNSITSASERALLGLHHLKIASLASNQLTSLQPEFFKDCRSLQEIYLQNNSLIVLAPGLFSGLEQLVVLDLSSNQLTSEWILGETFGGLVRLVFLNLSHNKLSRVDSLLFKSLYSLQVLNLEYNELSSVSSDAFSSMSNLHSLLLSHNKLKALEPFICKGLGVLAFLALDNNGIEVISNDAFSNCSNVMDLNLSGNKLTSVPEAVGALSLLRTLDVGENKIEDLSNSSASYAFLQNLYGLRLTDNKIRHVPKGALAKLGSLKIVNFAKNNISSIETGAFDNNPNLQAIRLDSNKLWNVSGLFRHIPNLLWLNISANSLTELRYEDFPPRLQWLDLRANSISLLGSCLEVDTPLKIKNLDLSHNQVSEISASNLPDSIQNLILSHNRIKTLAPYTFFRKANLSRVDLSSNELSHFDQNSLRISPSSKSGESFGGVELLLGHNPLKCDCSMEWFQGVLNKDGESATGSYPVILDVEKVTCSLSHKKLEKVPILDISPENFLCPYTSHCFPLCQCCDFDACDCAMKCPNNCSCYHDTDWRHNVVDCSSLGASFIPEKVPMDVTELRLDGNVLPNLDSHAFIGRKSLQSLYINSSFVQVIGNRTFGRLKLLRVLHLEGNLITRLEGREFEDLDGLQELYLHDNSLSFLGNRTFSQLISLKILTLHGNNLGKVTLWDMVYVKRLDEVTLAGNAWSCECPFSNRLREWVLNNREVISDASDVQCVMEKVGGRNELSLVRLLESKNVCSSIQKEPQNRLGESSSDLSTLKEESKEDTFWSLTLLITLSVLLLLLLVGVVVTVIYRWRKTLQVWFYAHCGIRLSLRPETNDEKEKLFDAFVSYSSKDEAWVRQVFAGELEGRSEEGPFRLCLRYRDLPPGGNYVGDTIVQAAEASRRTVVILSHHFLKGEWSRSDVKSAHHSVLKERGRRVILILLGDLPTKDLDPDLRLLLKNHTLLSPEDPKFWDKLRYALPEARNRGSSSVSVSYGRTNNGTLSSSPPNYQYQCPLPTPPPTASTTSTSSGGGGGSSPHLLLNMNSSGPNAHYHEAKGVHLHHKNVANAFNNHLLVSSSSSSSNGSNLGPSLPLNIVPSRHIYNSGLEHQQSHYYTPAVPVMTNNGTRRHNNRNSNPVHI